jgi:hypothetical protein
MHPKGKTRLGGVAWHEEGIPYDAPSVVSWIKSRDPTGASPSSRLWAVCAIAPERG